MHLFARIQLTWNIKNWRMRFERVCHSISNKCIQFTINVQHVGDALVQRSEILHQSMISQPQSSKIIAIRKKNIQ